MSDLRFEPVESDEVLLDWQHAHNLIIPTDPLSVEEIRVRAQRNRLAVAYAEDTLVGNYTVRPPADDPTTATVIARVLPEHRRHGHGEQIYQYAVGVAAELGATAVETVVLESNVDGLRFALRHGFTEIDRYVLDGHTTAFVDLRRESLR
ncbi:GNAT family N-acetyltransferase [Hamadaea sp.]|uniref:GNAT family N-acetyltransferase n=1 Tax=Hamadaea sp. TaxID=2024425 RepID=UPI0025BBB057|nr:GNAT family N-acetyltransferase [Hamadaea sp.]